MRYRGMQALLATVALFAATPVVAHAAADPTCATTFVDSSGGHWDLDSGAATGAINDGGIDTTRPLDGSIDRSDSYDTWPFLSVSSDGTTWHAYNAGTAACTSAQNGREVVFPPVTVDGVSLSRRVYVPGDGVPFARFVNVISNPTAAPVTVDVDLGGSPAGLGDLGSDSHTVVFATSSGDAIAGAEDSWAATWDGSVGLTGAPNGDPALGHVWQTAAGPSPDRLDAILPAEVFDEIFRRVTVAPGQSVIYVQLETQQATPAAAAAIAAQLAAEPPALFAGLSDADRAALVNFCVGDCDRDGRTDGTASTAVADNCVAAPNPDQSDLDGDGHGDACDDDIDGDGSSNDAENAAGTNPRNADTDGDGVRDGVDTCAVVAGKGANGCPRFDDATPPNVTVTSLRTKLRRAELRSGIRAAVACDEACAVDARVFGTRKGARIAKAGDLELGSKRLALGTGTRAITVRITKSLAKAVRKGARLRLVITATDAGHNATVVTRTVRVK